MTKYFAVVVLLAVVTTFVPQQAMAGGVFELVFGSKSKTVQAFAPGVIGAFSARDPRDLHEVSFDLDGSGRRVVLDTGIPVEKGLVLVGILAASTAARNAQKAVLRLDLDPKAFDVVPGPRSGEDQEAWLAYAVTCARYKVGAGGRAFKPFQTASPPFVFVVDSSTLLNSAHSIDIYLECGGTGASFLLPFRVVQLADETGQPIQSEYQKPLPAGAYSGGAVPPSPAAGDFAAQALASAPWKARIKEAAAKHGLNLDTSSEKDFRLGGTFRWPKDKGPSPFIVICLGKDGLPLPQGKISLLLMDRDKIRREIKGDVIDGMFVSYDVPSIKQVAFRVNGQILSVNIVPPGHDPYFVWQTRPHDKTVGTYVVLVQDKGEWRIPRSN